MSTSPNLPALRRMVTLLCKPMPKGVRFDMVWWYTKDPECGTQCCAAGLAASDPWFKARGLRLVMHENRGRTRSKTVQYGNTKGCRALSQFLHIPIEDTDGLFASGSYPSAYRSSPRIVAARIATYIKEHSS